MLNTAIVNESTSDPLMTSYVARALHLSEGMVRHLARNGQIPCVQIEGGLRLFHRIDVERLRAERALGGRTARTKRTAAGRVG
jgi:Helix-turn-helix domain